MQEEEFAMEKVYTIGEAARQVGLPASTVRFIERLKKSGMPIREIKEYIDLYVQGDSTIERRRSACVAPLGMPLDELPEDIRRTKERCGIRRF